ncbi:hypothetical protein GCM10023156_17110 [Novipirellula rosea]|uniref:Uncharacterized protein n=1 Tax=Novipirellula rosea TaxID=1031540 RepID=A0ABP8MIR8_9BACT
MSYEQVSYCYAGRQESSGRIAELANAASHFGVVLRRIITPESVREGPAPVQKSFAYKFGFGNMLHSVAPNR